MRTLSIFFLMMLINNAFGEFKSPKPAVSTSGSFTVSWDWTSTTTPTGPPPFQLVEKDLNRGTTSSMSLFTNSVARAKLPGRYEYQIQVAMCLASGCYYYSPAGNKYIVTVGNDAVPLIKPAEPWSAAGSTPYTTSVNHRGEAVVSIPIVTKPAVNGLLPQLSLVYNSGGTTAKTQNQGASGLLGYGWSLSGLSTISRCTTGKADVQGYISPANTGWGTQLMRPKLKYDSSDNLCLDDELLVLISGTHFQNGALYRTYKDSFKLVKLIESFDQESQSTLPYFEVRSPDGSVSVYGSSKYSRIQREINYGSSVLSPPYIWGIDTQRDSFGNLTQYSYRTWRAFSFQVNKQRIFPTSISYPGGTIRFEYISLNTYLQSSYGTLEDDGAAAGPDRWRFNHDSGDQLIAITTDTKKYSLLGSGQTHDELRAHGLKISGVQECGALSYADNYTSCLPAISLNWLPRTTAYPDFPQVSSQYYELAFLGGLTDSLGRVTEFQYDKIYGWQSSNKQNQFTEYPLPLPSTSNLSGVHDRTHGTAALDNQNEVGFVVVQLKKNMGVSSVPHVLKYQYRSSGTVSRYGKGFLGFGSVRVQDESRGTFTYMQNELDKSSYGPIGIVGETSSVHTYTSIYNTGATPISKSERRYSMKNFTHPNGAVTYLPVVDQNTDLSYEAGSLVSAQIKTNSVQIDSTNRVIASIVSTNRIGSKLIEESFTPQYLFHNAPYKIADADVKKQWISTTTMGSSVNSSDWRIGYKTNLTEQFSNGAGAYATDMKTKAIQYTLHPGTTKVGTEIHFPSDAQYEKSITYAYDSVGREASITVSGQNIETRTFQMPEYYGNSNVAQRTINPLGHVVTSSDFDPRHDLPQQTTDANGLTTITYYDAFGREALISDVDGVRTTYNYVLCITNSCESVPGKLQAIAPVFYKEVVSPISPRIREYYDSLGRVIRTAQQGYSSGEVITDIQYDELGRIYKTSMPYVTGATVYSETRSYDNLDRLTQVSRPDGGTFTTSYSIANLVPNETWRKVSAQEIIRKSDGTIASFTNKSSYFNSDEKVVRVVDAELTNDSTTTNFEYDALGFVKKSQVNGGSDGTTISTFAYDTAGNRTSSTDPNTGTVTFTYTALGELKTRTDAMGHTISYTYDKLGRTKTRTSIDGTDNWYYDPAGAKGKPSSETNNSGYTKNYYYTSGRLTNVSVMIAIPGLTTRTFSEAITRDYYGRMQTTTFPSGFQSTQKYNSQGYLTGFIEGTAGQDLSTIVRYGAFGIEEESLVGSTTTRSFDPKSGRTNGLYGTHGGVVQNVSYAWNSNGSLESRTNLLNGLKDIFTYDSQDRLNSTATKVTSTESLVRTLSYQFNRLGNVKSNVSSNSVDNQITNYQYATTTNAGPHAVSSVTIKGVPYLLNYNSNGAITQYDAQSSNIDKFISYNSINQPTNVTVGTSQNDSNPIARNEFKYGADGKRYYKKTTFQQNGTLRAEHTYYFGAYEVTYYDSYSSLSKSEKTRIGRLLIIKNTTPSGAVTEIRKVLHLDYQGSTDAVTTAGASTLFAFEPFGARRNSNWMSNITESQLLSLRNESAQLPSAGYTGQEMLDETGFIHMNGRLYDPQLSRFLSPDPLVQDFSDSQSWNRYSYAFNNPFKYSDPSGYQAIPTVTLNGCGEECQRRAQAKYFMDMLTRAGMRFNDERKIEYQNQVYDPYDPNLLNKLVQQSFEVDPGDANTIIAALAEASNSGIVLSIVSNVKSTTKNFDDGHAFLMTVDRNGKKTTYGLWPDWHRRVTDRSPANTDVRVNMELNDRVVESKSYKLTNGQARKLSIYVNTYDEWSYLHNCTDWARDGIYFVTDENLDVDNYFGFETPRELSRNIETRPSK